MRFSDAELVAVQARAALTGMAVGAWIGQVSVECAEDPQQSAPGLPDLLRLHADVLAVDAAGSADLSDLVRRLDVAVDVVVARLERGR